MDEAEKVMAADAGRLDPGVRPHALAEALRGIADGFDQQRPWFRPDPLVMSTLRRAADELDDAGDALVAEREQWRSAACRAVTAGYDDLPDALYALAELLRA